MSRMMRKLNTFLHFHLHIFLNWKLVSHHTIGKTDPVIQDNKEVVCKKKEQTVCSNIDVVRLSSTTGSPDRPSL